MDELQVIAQLLLDGLWVLWIFVDVIVVRIYHSFFAGQQRRTDKGRQAPVIHLTVEFVFVHDYLVVGVVVINQFYRTWRT